MQNILIYGGIAINIAGALLLMGSAFRRYMADGKQRTMAHSIKSQWFMRRTVSFGLMIGGSIVTIVGCII